MVKILSISLSVVLAFGAHSQTGPAPPGTPRAVVAKLPPPHYPPIALAARVSGDVRLNIVLRRDGTLVSALAQTGPPMLRQPAETLASQAGFACEGCTADTTPFEVTFRFEAVPPLDCEDAASPVAPNVEVSSGGVVVMTAQAQMFCDPAIDISRIRVRSIKCLFLWKCGWREEP